MSKIRFKPIVLFEILHDKIQREQTRALKQQRFFENSHPEVCYEKLFFLCQIYKQYLQLLQKRT